jgi:hypothetical protein
MGKGFRVVKTLRGRVTGESGPIRMGLPPELRVNGGKEVVVARLESPEKGLSLSQY